MSTRGVLLLAFVLSLTACGEAESNPWLEALQRERLARLVPAHGRLELDLETTTGREAFSKQDSAIITRSFAYRTLAAARHARGVVLRVAAETGWRVNRYPVMPAGLFFGWKRLASGEAKLTIGHYTKRRRYHVTITLEPVGG